MTATASPVYCKDCGSRTSWQRQPDQDIKSESGQIMWERWRCETCGATTIKPVWDESNASYNANSYVGLGVVTSNDSGLIIL